MSHKKQITAIEIIKGQTLNLNMIYRMHNNNNNLTSNMQKT